MATPESKTKREIRKLLDAYVLSDNLYYEANVPFGYGKPTLDFTGCHESEYFGIEAKYNEKPTARQEATIEAMRAAGAAVFVVGEKVYDELVNGERYSGMEELRAWLKR